MREGRGTGIEGLEAWDLGLEARRLQLRHWSSGRRHSAIVIRAFSSFAIRNFPPIPAVLTLTLLTPGSLPIDLTGITPSWARDKTLSEIERHSIRQGNRPLPIAELFRVGGDPADNRLQISGNLRSVHRIGAKLDSGAIEVEGTAGRRLGAEMSGGTITVHGDVGDWAGCQMQAGTIRVHGDAGDYLGSAYAGSTRGMRGGTLLVDGAAGREAAHCMRRGLIAVAGSLGPMAAMDMLAGTLVVLGNIGIRPGAGMRRGTILSAHRPERILPTFRHAGSTRPVIVRMLLLHLQRSGFKIPAELLDSNYDLYHGDGVSLGRGELLAATG